MKHSIHPSHINSRGHRHGKKSHHKNGFTLLEVILAISIMAILIGSVFTITNSSILLSQSIVVNQSEYRHKESFENYLEKLFINLPYDAKLELIDDENGFQSLTIHNPGTYFPSFRNDRYASLFTASIVKNRDGLLDLNTTWSNVNTSDFTNSESQQSLTLIGNLTLIKWEIYSVKDKTWYSTWSKELARPSHIRIIYRSNEQTQNTRTLWIPPRTRIQ